MFVMSSRVPVIAGLLLAWGCADPETSPCVERDEASAPGPRVSLMVGTVEVSAEIADTEDARRAAWVERRCDLDGLLWVPDEVGPASVTLCDLAVAVDLAFLRDGVVQALERDRPPCPGSCDGCPAYGEEGPPVDAVLWLLAGEVEIEVGDAVEGLAAVDLPTAAS